MAVDTSINHESAVNALRSLNSITAMTTMKQIEISYFTRDELLAERDEVRIKHDELVGKRLTDFGIYRLNSYTARLATLDELLSSDRQVFYYINKQLTDGCKTITDIVLRKRIFDFMNVSEDNENALWQFVNIYIAECYSYQLTTVINELDDEQLSIIIKHFEL